MIRPKRLPSACLLWPLLAPASASALTVEIQGVRLELQNAGASCIEIAGNYPGVKIESSQNGKTPRICYNSNKVNSITILDSTFVATEPVQKDISLKFEHGFPAGINGKIMTRAKLQGFFSTYDGMGIPVGDKAAFTAFFGQTEDHSDTIAEPFEMTVGDDLDSALFDYSGKEQYLISGPRLLQGILKFSFVKVGHKLTLAEKSGVSLDTGSTMADKLEALEPEPDAEDTTQALPTTLESPKQELPAELKATPVVPEEPKTSLPKKQKAKEQTKPAAAPAGPLPEPASGELSGGGSTPIAAPMEPSATPSR